MRFVSITAGNFGPHHGRLDLAPGMNLICGPNETGKSSWLAALYAALCGIRHGKGQPRKHDKLFEKRHRPWDPDARWYVEAVIELDDGTRVEFKRDLGAGTDSVVKFGSAGTTKDIAGDIHHDGAPDGAKLLGLTRDVFRRVAFVTQTKILAVSRKPHALAEAIERAASTASGDSTAAKAIARLGDFRKEYVGKDIANSTKPLRRAKAALDAAKQALARARQERHEYEKLELSADAARLEADRAARMLARARARVAEREAQRLERDLARARELDVATPEEPDLGTRESEEIQRLNSVLQDWENRPEPVALSGKAAAELRAEIAALPEMPAGDLEPHESVKVARAAYDEAVASVRAHAAARPAAVPEPPVDIDPLKLDSLAGSLAQPIPGVPATLVARYDEAVRRAEAAAARAERPRLSRAGAGLAAAGILTVLAAWLEFLDAAWLMPAGIAIALAGSVWWFVRDRAERVAESEAADREQARRHIETEIAPKRAAEEHARSSRAGAVAECERLGVAPERDTLRTLAAGVHAWRQHVKQQNEWQAREADLAGEMHTAAMALCRAIASREDGSAENVSARNDADDVASATYDAYIKACRHRAARAMEAEKRSSLEAALRDRATLEETAARTRAQREAAERALLDTARAYGWPAALPASPDDAAATLRRRREELSTRVRRKQAALRAWQDLQQILGGLSLDEFAAEAAAARERAAKLSAEVGANEAGKAQGEGMDGESESIEELANRVAKARDHVANLRGEAKAHKDRLKPIAVLEEAVAAAEKELARVQRLGDRIDRTIEFLERASEQTHGTIAPQLERAVTRWLPSVTAGRYARAVIDSSSLDVHVVDSTGVARRAVSHSHGTAEQVYLLLRAALAEYMVPSSESCPLLLDEVTAHADFERTLAILDVLRELGTGRQVILCTHDDRVRQWACSEFIADEGRVITLQ